MHIAAKFGSDIDLAFSSSACKSSHEAMAVVAFAASIVQLYRSIVPDISSSVTLSAIVAVLQATGQASQTVVTQTNWDGHKEERNNKVMNVIAVPERQL